MVRQVAMGLAIALAVMADRPAGAAVIDVFPGAGTPFQDAIDAAADGDMLVVHAGTYNEGLVVDRSLEIVAPPGAPFVYVDPPGKAYGLDIAADGVEI
jgi:nitrous oxidase accessory protein NosD